MGNCYEHTECCTRTRKDNCTHAECVVEDGEFCCEPEVGMDCDKRHVQVCSWSWGSWEDEHGEGEYGHVLRNSCCDAAADGEPCDAGVDCAIPRTGKCVHVHDWCDNRDDYRYNVWTKKCEYIPSCPRNE